MAYAPHRSAIDEVNQGMADGTYRQVVKDRGGVIDPATYRARRLLDDMWFGIHEAPEIELPDAIPFRSPYYVANPESHTDRG